MAGIKLSTTQTYNCENIEWGIVREVSYEPYNDDVSADIHVTLGIGAANYPYSLAYDYRQVWYALMNMDWEKGNLTANVNCVNAGTEGEREPEEVVWEGNAYDYQATIMASRIAAGQMYASSNVWGKFWFNGPASGKVYATNVLNFKPAYIKKYDSTTLKDNVYGGRIYIDK